MSQNQISTARQIVAEISAFEGKFATKTGGEVTAEAGKAWDGGNLKAEVLSAPSETGNIVLSRPYRSGKHRATMLALSKQVGRYRDTIGVYDLDPDLGAVGSPTVYANSLLVRLAWPEGNAASSDPSMIELEFMVDEGV